MALFIAVIFILAFSKVIPIFKTINENRLSRQEIVMLKIMRKNYGDIAITIETHK